jgi:hypothetical protein
MRMYIRMPRLFYGFCSNMDIFCRYWNEYEQFTQHRYAMLYKKTFNSKILSKQTPMDINAFIFYKCEHKNTKHNNGTLVGCQGLTVMYLNHTNLNHKKSTNINTCIFYSIVLQ